MDRPPSDIIIGLVAIRSIAPLMDLENLTIYITVEEKNFKLPIKPYMPKEKYLKEGTDSAELTTYSGMISDSSSTDKDRLFIGLDKERGGIWGLFIRKDEYPVMNGKDLDTTKSQQKVVDNNLGQFSETDKKNLCSLFSKRVFLASSRDDRRPENVPVDEHGFETTNSKSIKSRVRRITPEYHEIVREEVRKIRNNFT